MSRGRLSSRRAVAEVAARALAFCKTINAKHASFLIPPMCNLSYLAFNSSNVEFKLSSIAGCLGIAPRAHRGALGEAPTAENAILWNLSSSAAAPLAHRTIAGGCSGASKNVQDGGT